MRTTTECSRLTKMAATMKSVSNFSRISMYSVPLDICRLEALLRIKDLMFLRLTFSRAVQFNLLRKKVTAMVEPASKLVFAEFFDLQHSVV